MEFLPTLYESAQWYAFFCIVTALTVAIINIKYLYQIRPGFGLSGTLTYLLTTMSVGFVFAPIFVLILLFFGEVYNAAIINVLSSDSDETEE